MKIKRFTVTELSIPQIEKFLSDSNIAVMKVNIVSHETIADTLYIFYEDVSELLAAEKEELKQLDQIAQQLEKDEDYQKLKNATQREIFLLLKYDIPSHVAKRVIEIYNIRQILQKK